MEEFFYPPAGAQAKKTLVGIRVKNISPGFIPLTDKKESLQVLLMNHKKGTHKVEPHFHAPLKRSTNNLQECLIVKKGKVKIDLYALDKKKFKSIFLKEGELFILLNGGLSVEFIDDAEVYEVKNGPFKEDKVDI